MKKHRRLFENTSRFGNFRKVRNTTLIFITILIAGLATNSTFAISEAKKKALFPTNYVTTTSTLTFEVVAPGSESESGSESKSKSTATVPETGNHGFLMTDLEDADKTENKSFIFPIIVCIVATVIAFLVLSKAKLLQRKSSDFSKSFKTFNINSPKILQKIKNPALLLAICFGIGVASPLFILNSITSTATTSEIEKINYSEHDFDADIDAGVNPFKIALKYPSSNSENDTQFSLLEVKLEATTYNPTGYTIFLDPDCVATNEVAGEKSTCKKNGTSLVGEKAKIPSIKKETTLEEFKKQTSAGWGWSTDGKTFFPADSYIELENGGTIYYAIKSADSTPSGEYQIPQNIIALTNSIDDEFGEYTLSYSNPAITEKKTFYKKDPGYFTVIDPEQREGYLFNGWATDASAKKAVYKKGDRIKPAITETKLYGVWEKTGYDYDYRVVFDQGYYFHEIMGDGETPCGTTEGTICGDEQDIEDIKRRAGVSKYYQIHETPENGEHFVYIVKAIQEPSNDSSITIDLNSKNSKDEFIYVPKLKGYTFLGWTDFDFTTTSCNIPELESHGDSDVVPQLGESETGPAASELEEAINCLSNQENGTFYHFSNNKFEALTKKANQNAELGDGDNEAVEGENKDAKIVLNPDQQSLRLYAVYKLNHIYYKVEYWDGDPDNSESKQLEGSPQEEWNDVTNFVKTHNDRVVNVRLRDSDIAWQSAITEDSFPQGSETIIVTWEDMGYVEDIDDGDIDNGGGNNTVAIEKLMPQQSSTGGMGSADGLSQSTNLGTKEVIALLEKHYNGNDEEDEEEDEEPKKTTKKSDKDNNESGVKIIERRVAVAPSTTAQPTTESSEEEKTEEEDEEEIEFYEDDGEATTYFTKPLGVTEKIVDEESSESGSVVTIICIVVLIASGIGIAAIILFPMLSKNQRRRRPSNRF